MPEDAPPAKLAATPATARRSSRTTAYREDRAEIAGRLERDEGLTLVPPYDDPLVMAGQGTVALELLARPARSTCSSSRSAVAG